MSNVDPQPPEFQGTTNAATPQQIAAMQEAVLATNPNSFGGEPTLGQQYADLQQGGQTASSANGNTQVLSEPRFTAEDIERFRQQERDKLYPTIEKMRQELDQVNAEREAREAEEQRLREEAETEARRAAEAELDTRQLLETFRVETQEKLDRMGEEREQALALLNQERHYAVMQEYRQQQIAVNEQQILPQFRDFINGATEAEIDAQVADAIRRTQEIQQDVMATMQQQRTMQRGTAVSGMPAAGPMENQPEQRQFSAAEIAAMDPQTYQKYRRALHQAGTAQFYGQQPR